MTTAEADQRHDDGVRRLGTTAYVMFRNGEEDRQHAPALLYIDHLDAPFPGIPAPRGKERRPPNQLHGVTVCRPKIVKFHALRGETLARRLGLRNGNGSAASEASRISPGRA